MRWKRCSNDRSISLIARPSRPAATPSAGAAYWQAQSPSMPPDQSAESWRDAALLRRAEPFGSWVASSARSSQRRLNRHGERSEAICARRPLDGFVAALLAMTGCRRKRRASALRGWPDLERPLRQTQGRLSRPLSLRKRDLLAADIPAPQGRLGTRVRLVPGPNNFFLIIQSRVTILFMMRTSTVNVRRH